MTSKPRPPSSAPATDPRPVELHDVVRGALTDAGPQLRGRALSVRARIDPEPLEVQADGTRLLGAVTELLMEEVAATPVRGRLTLHLARRGRDAVLTVEHGSAVTPAERRHRRVGEARPSAARGADARAWVAAQNGAVTPIDRGWSTGFELRLPLAGSRRTPPPSSGA